MTQAIDPRHRVLGFMVGWIIVLRKHVESMVVIGQEVGSEARGLIGSNVHIETLGKEKNVPRWKQVLRFVSILIHQRKEYGVIFIHMTPIWAIIAWPIAVIFQKKLILWYEAPGRGWNVRLATFMVDKILSATPGVVQGTTKQRVIGHGIDTDLFKSHSQERTPRTLISVGRVTPVKRYHVLLRILRDLGDGYTLTIVGTAFTESDKRERERLLQLVEEYQLQHRLMWTQCDHSELPKIYNRSWIYVHTADSCLDKALLEAMACGTLCLSCAPKIQGSIPAITRSTEASLVNDIQSLCGISSEEYERKGSVLRAFVEEHHSLSTLPNRILTECRD